MSTRLRTRDGRRPSRFEYSRVTVTFDSGGDACTGWLYRPDRPRRAPVVVMAGGLALPRETLQPIAERFAERGLAVFCFDYRGIGDSEGTSRNRVSPARQLADWQEAVARVRDLSAVDNRKVILWGHSLGAASALAVAAEDARVRGVVAVAPVLSGSTLLGMRSIPDRAKAVLAGVRDRVQSLALGPYTVPVVGDAAALALLPDTALKGGYRSRHPDGVVEVPARAFLELARFGVDLDGVSCPTLFVAGRHDDVAPPEEVLAAAEELPGATALRLPLGHLELLDDDAALAHQLTFVEETVGRD